MKKVALAILGVGLAAIAAYLEVNGKSATWVWIGVVLIFLSVI